MEHEMFLKEFDSRIWIKIRRESSETSLKAPNNLIRISPRNYDELSQFVQEETLIIPFDRAACFNIPAIDEALPPFGLYLPREEPVVVRTVVRPARPHDNQDEEDDENDEREKENDTYDVMTQTRNPVHRSANARHRGVKSHA